MAEEVLSEADYHHGAEAVAYVFAKFLLRHAVEFELIDDLLVMRIGKTEVSFRLSPEWTSSGFKRLQKSREPNKILVRPVDVRQS